MLVRTFFIVIGITCLIAAITYFNNRTIDLVVARYNEDLAWLSRLDRNKFRNIIVYNKGKPFSYPGVKIIDLPNVGRCDHTYLYHIIQNYHNLATVTLFLPGSCNNAIKKHIADKLIHMTIITRNSCFHGHHYNNVLSELYDFKLDEWKSSESANYAINKEIALHPCPERPFGKWYEKNFGHLHIQSVAYLGMFSVSKKHIQNRSLQSYKNLIKYLDHHSNPEAGHYFERAWMAIFFPVEKSCII